MIKYRITICTGNVSGSGTDASVFLNVFGDLGDTGERLMFLSKNNVNKFEKGNVSISGGKPSHRTDTRLLFAAPFFRLSLSLPV